MKIKSLSHVGVTVSNFEKAVKWYWEMFKFPLIAVEEMNEKEVEKLDKLYNLKNTKLKLGFLKVPGGGIIEIFEFKPSLKRDDICWNKVGLTHITLDVSNIKKWYKKLKEKGVEFMCEPQKTGATEWVFLKDMDGNLIELIDLKFNYIVLRYFGGIASKIIKNIMFKEYYK